MFTPEFIRENTLRMGRGEVIETSGETHKDVEIFAGENTFLAIRTHAVLMATGPKEVVMIFPMSNVRRVEVTSQE